MITVIEKSIRRENLLYPVCVHTEHEDERFLWLVLRQWAQYDPLETEALISDGVEEGEVTDKHLRTEGFVVPKASFTSSEESITLIKVGVGDWIIERITDLEQLEEFVEALSDGLDPEPEDELE